MIKLLSFCTTFIYYHIKQDECMDSCQLPVATYICIANITLFYKLKNTFCDNSCIKCLIANWDSHSIVYFVGNYIAYGYKSPLDHQSKAGSYISVEKLNNIYHLSFESRLYMHSHVMSHVMPYPYGIFISPSHYESR